MANKGKPDPLYETEANIRKAAQASLYEPLHTATDAQTLSSFADLTVKGGAGAGAGGKKGGGSSPPKPSGPPPTFSPPPPPSTTSSSSSRGPAPLSKGPSSAPPPPPPSSSNRPPILTRQQETDLEFENVTYSQPTKKGTISSTPPSMAAPPPAGSSTSKRPPMQMPTAPASSAASSSSFSTPSSPGTNAPNSVILDGVAGYAKFLGGIYRRIESTTHGGRPAFRMEKPLPAEVGPAAGKLAFMYYHPDNKAWVVGMRLGSSGVAAFKNGEELLPTDGHGDWHVSDEKGKFLVARGAVCIAGGGNPLPPEDVVRPGTMTLPRADSSVLPTGTSRVAAETLLKDFSGKPGAFLVRESTSLPDAYVLSVLSPGDKIVHLRVDSCKPKGYSISGSGSVHTSLGALIKHYSSNALPNMQCKLTKCCSGEELYERLPS